MSDDLAFATVVDLGRLLRQRKTSATELATLFLDRLDRLGPSFNAVVTTTRERALAEAGQADREIRQGQWRGPLHGIPYGVKDLLATKGYPTTWGAEPYREQRLDADATVVERLAAAGAVLVAKLAMVELAGGMGYNQANASFTGPGKTPWNVAYWSGGSSSGPGAAVAAGLVPFAIGSETSGSILTPAAYCGVTGLRPTYGLVSRHGAMALAWTMDKLGPLGRTAEDCALVLAAIAGPDPRDPSAVARGFKIPPAARGGGGGSGAGHRFKIGIPKGAAENIQPEVAANFRASIAALQDAIEVVEGVELPDLPYGAVAGMIIAAEGASAFDDLLKTGRLALLTAPEDRTGGYPALAISAPDYLRALRVRRPMQRALDAFLKQFDAIATPTRTTVASPIDKPFRDGWPGITGGANVIGPTNVVGVPGISVPNGFGVQGLPTGLAFAGRAFDEAKLVTLARLYQSRTDWHTKRPPLA
ncbi:MAG TPA: amidase [Gemmatimonadales bacterium]|jgi:aspartyl-tRNA(Asn)/glutamyl-tRNA(Gln) amidotransferase subunit A|nr:amidase [Gemmatimonadales bacterium]